MNILFILITTILIFGTTNAFALNYDYVVKAERTVFNSNKKVLLQNYDSTLTSTSDSYSQRTEIYFDGNYTNTNNYGFIRFNITGIDSQLENFTSSAEYTALSYYYRIQLRETTGVGYSKCELDKNYILCPLRPNGVYTSIMFDNIKTIDIGQVYIHFLIFSQQELIDYIGTNNTNDIINNQNQNTETIVNNITTPTIDSNTTNTDSLISIPNSNGKNVVLDLLMTPVNFVTNVINSFSNSCVSYNLGNLMGTDIILPCLNLQSLLGSTVYTVIDCIFTFGMLFVFIRSVKRFIHKSLLLANDVNSEVSIF